MRKTHFFKARSRIGLTHPPIRQTEFNYGVEEGGDAVLTDKFLNKFPGVHLSSYSFSDPEKIDTKNYWKILVEELVEFTDLINKNLMADETQITLGGDNTVTFSSLLALIRRVKDVKKIGYIQFDSHGEMNSFKGSDSKNFHGMYMRPFFDQFDIEIINDLIPDKLGSEQAFFIGDLVLDGDEPIYFNKNSWRSIGYAEYKNNKAKYQKALSDFIKRYDWLHVNFDIDVLDRREAGATGIPEDGRWLKEDVMQLLDIVISHPRISFDLSEINPQREGAKRTIKTAQEILEKVIFSKSGYSQGKSLV